MNSAQIDYILRHDPCTAHMWRGVFPRDLLKQQSTILPAGYIANTAPSGHSGEHWVAFFFPADGDSAEFFDSYAFNVAPDFKKFLKAYGHKNWIGLDRRIQGGLTTVCGQHCIFFLTLRARGWTMKEIMKQFEEVTNWNDSLVAAFVNKHHGTDTKVIDYDFVVQSCGPKF